MNLKEQFKRIGGKLNENPLDVDHTTMKLKSDIDQKWGSIKDMESDIMQWFQSVVAANGQGVGEEIYDAIEDILEQMDAILEEYH
tara:strand:+ start:191 stop:445 length:255 start_codon:yes stop_codon:yes gene_type:complete